jgi:hypothetical protein
MPRLVDSSRAPERAGLISTMFVMTAHDPADPLAAALIPGNRVRFAGLGLSELYLPQQQGQFDMTLQVLRHAAGARAQLKYNTSLFTSETAQRLADDYVGLLRSASGDLLPATLCDLRELHPAAGRVERRGHPGLHPDEGA